jgi:hypothetical protein
MKAPVDPIREEELDPKLHVFIDGENFFRLAGWFVLPGDKYPQQECSSAGR